LRTWAVPAGERGLRRDAWRTKNSSILAAKRSVRAAPTEALCWGFAMGLNLLRYSTLHNRNG